jgi:hypothetical protein
VNYVRTIISHRATSLASPKIVNGGFTIDAEPRDRIQSYTTIATKKLDLVVSRARYLLGRFHMLDIIIAGDAHKASCILIPIKMSTEIEGT